MESKWLAGFQAMYQGLNANNLDQLELWYHPEVCFVDPLHEIHGLTNLKSYFGNMYANVLSIHFDYLWQLQSESEVVLGWKMSFSHSKLNGGQPIEVNGSTRLQLKEGKVIHHQDYFDAGAMLYEQIPLLGSVIRSLKRRAAGDL